MKAVVQRVKSAKVDISDIGVGEIKSGLMVLLGIHQEDTTAQADALAKKLVSMRIFSDIDDKMNLSLLDTAGEMLVVSNFTLYANCKKGNRPSFIEAARPETAIPLYNHFLAQLKSLGAEKVEAGEFGADMQVYIQNDGPVTIVVDTDEIMPKPQNN